LAPWWPTIHFSPVGSQLPSKHRGQTHPSKPPREDRMLLLFAGIRCGA
jgi:hypothetical protein